MVVSDMAQGLGSMAQLEAALYGKRLATLTWLRALPFDPRQSSDCVAFQAAVHRKIVLHLSAPRLPRDINHWKAVTWNVAFAQIAGRGPGPR